MFESFVGLVREIYQTEQFIPLHEPRFLGNEKKYVLETIDNNFVSSVGAGVNQFETKLAAYCGAKYAVATISGTAALHIALLLAGVKPGEEVITQAVSFVATANAIVYCGAQPIFIDVDDFSYGMSATSLADFLKVNIHCRNDGVWNKLTGKRIAACLPMHSFGHPCQIDEIGEICQEYGIPLVEDAAEALGSTFMGKHCGTFGLLGAISFNGNKIMTTGGGGMILTDDAKLAEQARHITTTAKLTHSWQFVHDQVGFNYRLPNLNAALGLAQLESLPFFVQRKRELAEKYKAWAKETNVKLLVEPQGADSNYWLNGILLNNATEREKFLSDSKERGIMTRPLWELLSELPMYRHCQTDALLNSKWLQERLVNIPSSVPVR
jgi:perosamine synthetase